MPSFTTKRRVPFDAGQMYAIVADVERYPEFLPMCEALTVRSRSELEGGKSELVATMAIGYKAIREKFTTRVLLDPGKGEILVAYIEGPFRHLENRWRFFDMSPGSEIDFFIDYEFRSPLLAILMGAVFDKAFRRFAESFEERARFVYGRPPVA